MLLYDVTNASALRYILITFVITLHDLFVVRFRAFDRARFYVGIFHGEQIDANDPGGDRSDGFVFVGGQSARSELRELHLRHAVLGDQHLLRHRHAVRGLPLFTGVFQSRRHKQFRGKKTKRSQRVE